MGLGVGRPMKSLLLLVSLLLIVGSVEADIRVLIRFDESGHYVHRVFQVAVRQDLSAVRAARVQNLNQSDAVAKPLPVSPIQRGRSWQNAQVSEGRKKQSNVTDGFARLVWFDNTGKELTQTEVDDPRIVHSPSHTEAVNASRSGKTEGAWLVSGPESAVKVTISLPESTVLSLAAELWILDLSR